MNSTAYGFGEKIQHWIIDVVCTYPKVDNLILYGSRATGTYRDGSDIDLAIDAPTMDAHEFAKLWNEIDDLPIIYPMDVVHLQSVSNPVLRKAIDDEGIILWSSND